MAPFLHIKKDMRRIHGKVLTRKKLIEKTG